MVLITPLSSAKTLPAVLFGQVQIEQDQIRARRIGVLPFAPQKRSLLLPHPMPRCSGYALASAPRSVRSHESLLGCAAPRVAFTPCEQAATGDRASPEHGKNGGREGELHLTIHRTSSSSNSRLGAEALGQTRCRAAEGAARKHVLVVQEGTYSLYQLDAGSNSAHRPVSNKLR
jgi:hypothetical protein